MSSVDAILDMITSPMEEWTAEDTQLLRGVLTNPTLIKALSTAYAPYRDMVDSLRIIELETHEGVVKGARLQGRLDGSLTLITRLIELIDEGDEDAARG